MFVHASSELISLKASVAFHQGNRRQQGSLDSGNKRNTVLMLLS